MRALFSRRSPSVSGKHTLGETESAEEVPAFSFHLFPQKEGAEKRERKSLLVFRERFFQVNLCVTSADARHLILRRHSETRAKKNNWSKLTWSDFRKVYDLHGPLLRRLIGQLF